MPEDIAVITGASKGIGCALAREMLDAGYRVIGLSRHLGELNHPRLESHEVDLTDPKAVAEAAAAVSQRHDITHFIHNAGVIRPALLEDTDPADITLLGQLHLASAVTLLQAFLPSMKSHRFGRVIFNASRAALGAPTRTAYSASKAGMIGMARTWALELAPHGITVNVVAPGPIQTDNFWEIIPKGSEREAELARRIPIGRLGTVDDVTHAFMFFADRRADFVTGQTLFVCGGASVGGLSI